MNPNATLLHRLRARLEAGDGPSTTLEFISDDGVCVARRTLTELVDRSRRIATLLREKNLRPDARAILCYGPSLDFIEGFLGCLIAGVVPAAILPPNPASNDVERLSRVVENAQAEVILSHRSYQRARRLGQLSRMARLRNRNQWPSIPWILTDRPERLSPANIELPDPGKVAFLQYTSGSTGTPRGIRVTHKNLAHNLAYLCEANTLHRDTRLCIWLPQYHDMGLIGCIFTFLWNAAHLTMFSPFAFLKRPAMWLEQLSLTRATVTAAPNFALDLVSRKVRPDTLKRIDLSAIEVFVCGAEPILATSVDRFYQRLASTGLRPDTFSACYGLAENVVAVANRGRGRIRVDPEKLTRQQLVASDADNAVTLMGCGRQMLGMHIQIVDPSTSRPLSDGSVGEIWVHSPSTCDGYERDPEQTKRVFKARLNPDDGRDWLRTGDLGVLYEGELYPTGRLKELIIVRGRNLLPHDIEAPVRACHAAVRPGGLAAFGIDASTGTEQIGLCIELRPGTEQYAAQVAERACLAVHRAVGFRPGKVVVGPKGLVPKTTSGKVKRLQCRQQLLDGSLSARSGVRIFSFDTSVQAQTVKQAEATWTLDALLQLVGQTVDAELTLADVDTPLLDLGLDSVQTMELNAALEAALGEPVPTEHLLGATSLRDLAGRLGLTNVGSRERRVGCYRCEFRPVKLSGPPGGLGC